MLGLSMVYKVIKAGIYLYFLKANKLCNFVLLTKHIYVLDMDLNGNSMPDKKELHLLRSII